MKNKNALTIPAAALAFLTLSACTTLEYVPIDRSRPENTRALLAVGETVKVRMQSGDQKQFRITALEPDAIIGRDQRVEFKDIDLLEVQARDYQGTAMTVLVAGAAAVVFVGLAIIDAELDDDSQPATRCTSTDRGGTICSPR